MKVLVLTQDLGEASRWRVQPYLGPLAAAGLRPRVIPFAREQAGLGGLGHLGAGLRRIAFCLLARRYAAVWCEGPLLPRWPRACERLLRLCLPRRRLFDLHRPEWPPPPARPGTLIAVPDGTTVAAGTIALPWSVALAPVAQAAAEARLALFAGHAPAAERIQLERQLRAAHLPFTRVGAGQLPPPDFEAAVLACDLAVFASGSGDRAGQERDLLRCLALGRPVLIGADHALAPLVSSAAAGMSVIDQDQWVAAILDLRARPECQRQLGHNARSWVAAERDAAIWGRRIADLLASPTPNIR